MKLLKTALIILAGLGSAWAAGQISDRLGSPRSEPGVDNVVLAQAKEAKGGESPASDESDIEALSEEELEAEMQRIQKAASGENELEEFVPSKPLAADIPIPLPSDI
jgi:hypothetical protein